MPWRMVALCGVFAGGVVTSDLVQSPLEISVLAGLAGAFALIAGWLRIRRAGEPAKGDLLHPLSKGVVILLLTGTFAVGFADLGLRSAALDRALVPRFSGRAVLIEGTLASDPEPSGKATGFRLKVRSVEERRAAERVYVRLFGKPPRFDLGDAIRIEGKVRALDAKDSFDAHLRRKRVTAVVTGSADSVKLIRESRNPILNLAEHLRRRLEEACVRSMPKADAGLLLGLTIGDERLIPDEVVEDFRVTSLSHLTAVSGANVAMVLAAVILILRAAGTSKRAQIASGIATVLFFAVITRWEPSVLRATLMSIVAGSAFWFGRRSDPMSGLLITFLALTAADPFLLWSVGFQLSFLATAGIICFSPVLLERLKRWPRLPREALCVSLSAQLGVAPMLAFHFGQLSLVSVPANVIAFPLVAPITVLGMASGLLGSISVPAAIPLAFLARFFVSLLRGVASAFADLPFAFVSVPEVNVTQLVVVYVLIVAAMLWLSGLRRVGRQVVVLAAAFLVVGLIVPPASSEPPTGLRLTFLDVGQGDAALIESPGGARVLIDGGPDEKLLASHLRRRGVRRIDLLVVSHFHFDHAAGLQGAFDASEIRRSVHPGVETPLIRRMSYAKVATSSSSGDSFQIGDLRLEILSPTPTLREEASLESAAGSGEGSGLNDSSLVIRIPWAFSCALFTGDIEERGQQELLERERRSIDCTIMKAPHHGSARLEESFVDAVDPEWVPISVGRNDFGHPTLTALKMFNVEGARVLRTDKEGDIVLTVDDAGSVSHE
jgi:competence protein ComEC